VAGNGVTASTEHKNIHNRPIMPQGVLVETILRRLSPGDEGSENRGMEEIPQKSSMVNGHSTEQRPTSD
jgi:hypothetical protein